MTSANSDESLVGFALVNLRTKEPRYYTCAGATESSAMSSAEGQVQQMSYKATFPLLLNIADRPTYFLSLKDAAGLVKMYAFVDVQQYQIVGTGSTVADAQNAYIATLTNDDQARNRRGGHCRKWHLAFGGWPDRGHRVGGLRWQHAVLLQACG